MNIDAKSINIQNLVDQVKDLAGLSSKDIVGLDIGLSSVKIARVTKSGSGYKLQNYASIPLPETCLIEDEIQKEEEIKEAIKEAFSRVKVSGNQVCLGLFGPNTVTRKLQLAGGDPEEIEDQVLWEAEQYLPFPVEESSLDHFLVGENEGGGVDVIVAGIRKDILLDFKSVVEEAGGKVKLVDLAVLALNNLFEYVASDLIFDANNESSSWLILDIGAQKTICLIYKSGMPIFAKEISVGGSLVTEEIQRQLGVNYREAEDLKVTVDESGNLPEEIMTIVNDINETFYGEIKRTIDFYVNSTSDDSLSSCYVTGGSVQLHGLLEGITDVLGLDVSVINPFSMMDYDKSNIDEDELSDIAYRGAVAIGLGMRKLD